MQELIPPTQVRSNDSVVPQSVNNPINELFEMIKRIDSGEGNISEVFRETIEQYGTMPIGAVYTQYPNMKAPHELWPGEWTNVTGNYANCFFRAEGDLSNNFNAGYQNCGSPNITGWDPKICAGYTASSGGALYRNGTGNYGALTTKGKGCHYQVIYFDASRSNGTYGAAAEVRPYNHAIRVWLRTA